MSTRRVAVVFGGAGFLGRYVVKRLAAAGYVVRVAGRDPEAAMFLKPMGRVGQVVPLFAPLADETAVARAVDAAEVVVNLVGILSERRAGDFQRVQAEGAGRVARLAAAAGVRDLVHVSAIGADPAADALYARTKGEGETAVRAAFPRAMILRPSIVFGPEDQFFNRFGAMAAWLPIMPVIMGDTRFQPVYVGDVADAVMAAIGRADPTTSDLLLAGAPASGGPRLFELGGPQVCSFRDLMAYILQVTGRARRLLELPNSLVRLQAALGEHLPGKPLTRDQLKMLGHDNVCAAGMPGLLELGIVPTPMDLIVPQYLARFRAGGLFAASGASDKRSLSGPITSK
jgi:NADH dehydrogenase